MNVLKFIIGLIIILCIANTMTMTVLERTSEIGTLMALGDRRKKILRLFLTESLILGIFGGLLGLALGAVAAAIISRTEFPCRLLPE